MCCAVCVFKWFSLLCGLSLFWHVVSLLVKKNPWVSDPYFRSCRSVLGRLSKEKWTSTTEVSYLPRLLLLATKLEYKGSSVQSQGKYCKKAKYLLWLVFCFSSADVQILICPYLSQHFLCVPKSKSVKKCN